MRAESKRPNLSPFLLVGAFVAFAICAPNWFAQSQEGQPPASGPKPDVGETVLVPKKTQPAPPPQAPQKPEKIDPKEVFTLATATNLVNVEVLVLDNSGYPVPNLGRKNFRLYDDAVPQAISNFGVAEAPMTICVVIEFSRTWWGFLYLAIQYSYNFVNYIQPKDWVAVVAFDIKPEILQDFTQDRYQVIGALDRLRIPGFSEIDMYDALGFTLDRMKDIQGRKAILLICTGFDTFSRLTYDQILKIVRASNTAIYPISLLEFVTVRTDEDIDTLQAKNGLNYIAKYSGGQAYFPRFESQLPGIYEQIAGQLRQQYSLGFVPSNQTKDGKYHKLKVELVDEAGNPLKILNEKGKVIKHRVVAREGYYAPKS